MNFYDSPFKKAFLQRLSVALLISSFLLTFSTRSSANSLTQYKPSARQDSVEILQQCLDLPVIQNYFTRHSDGTLKQVYIMQYPVKFPDGLAVSKFGQPVLFRSRADIRSEKAEVFLIVKTFSIAGDDASVNFTLNSDYTTKPNILEITVQLHRSGQTWAVSQKQIRRLI